MVKRALYYWAGIYRDPMRKGTGYRELKTVILINILNFTLFEQTVKYHTSFHLTEDEEGFRLTDVLNMHFFEMPKLLTSWKSGKLRPQVDILARWLLLLGIVDKKNKQVYEDIYKELEEIAMNDPDLQASFQDWEKLSSDKDKWFEYESRLKVVLDDLAAVREAELRAKEQREEGRKETIKVIARNLLKKGIEIHVISQTTGLTEDEINKLND